MIKMIVNTNLLYQKAIKGDSESQYALAMLYFDGEYSGPDLPNAINWLKLAAEQGHAAAQYQLAFCYQNEIFFDKNNIKAFDLYKLSAEQGYVEAQYELGMCYCLGTGINEDWDEAFKLFKAAAIQGNINASYMVGICYMWGNGIGQDLDLAIIWLRVAAEKKLDDAYIHLGRLCICSKDKRLKEEGLIWLKKASHKGNSRAQLCLGLSYKYAIGVDKDLTIAAKWLKMVAKKGNKCAKAELDNLHSKNTELDWTLFWDYYY